MNGTQIKKPKMINKASRIVNIFFKEMKAQLFINTTKQALQNRSSNFGILKMEWNAGDYEIKSMAVGTWKQNKQ